MAIWKKNNKKEGKYNPPDSKLFKEIEKDRGTIPSIISEGSEFKGNIKTSGEIQIDGVLNAVVVDGLPIGKSVLQGEGAGAGPTSSALISNLCSILKGEINYPFGISANSRKKISKFNVLNHSCSAYLRIEAKDLPGVLSSITRIFAKNKISIKNLIQDPDKKKRKATIIIITHENLEKNYNNLISSLTKNKFIIKKPTFIRIEKV